MVKILHTENEQYHSIVEFKTDYQAQEYLSWYGISWEELLCYQDLELELDGEFHQFKIVRYR